LARYSADGIPDESFGTLGKVTTNFNVDVNIARAVVTQEDDKIVVAGSSGYDFGVFRYNPDGSLDPTFDGETDGNGKVLIEFGPDVSHALSVAIQADGMIVAAGHFKTEEGRFDIALARFWP
jgi:uncharacterized delta-60 repeat protein